MRKKTIQNGEADHSGGHFGLVSLFCLPLVIFAIPAGLGNNIVQPVSAVLFVPYIYVSIRHAWGSVYLLSIVIISSVISYLVSFEHSIYQSLRSGLPFMYLSIILSSHEYLVSLFRRHVNKYFLGKSVFEFCIHFFIFGQMVQVLLFFSGIKLANTSFLSADSFDRIYVYPLLCTMLIFYWAAREGRVILGLMSLLIVLATGGKTSLLCCIILMLYSLVGRFDLRRAVLTVALLCAVPIAILSVNPTSVRRLNEFLLVASIGDITRQYEITYAKQAFSSSARTALIGNGIATPLTPGVPTTDIRWFENSKYDIENGYWALLAKIGLVGFALLIWLYAPLTKNANTRAVVLIVLINSISSSAPFFANFDGVYLLVWSIIFEARRVNYSVVSLRGVCVLSGMKR